MSSKNDPFISFANEATTPKSSFVVSSYTVGDLIKKLQELETKVGKDAPIHIEVFGSVEQLQNIVIDKKYGVILIT